jgi:UDP-glucoronosyl and UDP-glucosyl transferase
VPYTYLWSPGLVPKPEDWGPEIDIAGFVFLDLASTFEPPEDLVKFLDAGEPPVYIGFGSIIVDDPDRFTKMIFEAVEKAGVRALVSKGWGGLGGEENTPENIYMLENTPHDWLFPKVKAVVHHGGAGTTAIGLKCGKPTMIVPFFGDQQFWGNMVGKAGAGAQPVPCKELTTEKLADGIRQLLTDEARIAAEEIAKDIEEEGDGAQNAVRSFHRSLQLRGEHSMRCCILEDRVAVWKLKNTNLRLSALAADILVEQKKLHWRKLRLIRHYEWNDFEGPGEPMTGAATAIVSTFANVASGIGSVPFKMAQTSKRRQKHEQKKRRKLQRKQAKRTENGRDTIATSKHGTAIKDQATGVTTKNEGFLTNGRAVADYNTTNVNKSTRGGEIDDEKAPAKGSDKATNDADMGKHTTVGSPLTATNSGMSNEEGTDGGDSLLSADPEQNAAEEILDDVGDGLGKSGEALIRG